MSAPDGESATEKRPSRKKLWIVLGSIAGAIVFVVTAATTFIPIVADMLANETRPDSLVVGDDALGGEDQPGGVPTSEPVALEDGPVIGDLADEVSPADVVIWNVPVDAPFASFPAEGWTVADGCGADQLAWLEEHAGRDKVAGWNLGVFVRNTATDGASMSIDNVRLEGEWTPGAPTVALQCGPGVGGDPVQFGLLQRSGAPATWGEDPYLEYGEGAAVGAVEGTPLTLNLAPGELGILELLIPAVDESFEGRLVADMLTPEEQLVILGEEVRIAPQRVRGLALDLGNFDGVLTCILFEEDTGYPVSNAPCDPAQAAELMREAAAAR